MLRIQSFQSWVQSPLQQNPSHLCKCSMDNIGCSGAGLLWQQNVRLVQEYNTTKWSRTIPQTLGKLVINFWSMIFLKNSWHIGVASGLVDLVASRQIEDLYSGLFLLPVFYPFCHHFGKIIIFLCIRYICFSKTECSFQ